MARARIGIATGHSSATDGERLFEYQQCAPVTKILSHLLNAAGHKVLEPPDPIYLYPNNKALTAKVDFFNQMEVDLAVEVHINAGGGDYSTALYWGNNEGAISSKGAKAAGCIADAFAAFPWRSIGAQSQTYFGRSLYLLNNTHAPAVIVEAGFKDNEEHRAILGTKRGYTLHAASIYAGIESYLLN